MKRIVILTVLALAAATFPVALRAQEEAPKKEEAPKQEAPKKKMKTRTEMITWEEVQGTQGAGDALELVKRLRPKWLAQRAYSASPQTGVLGHQEVQVYLDDIHQGGSATLSRISVDLVGEMRYLTGSEAAARFGLNNQSGAILVTTRGKLKL